MKATDRWIAAAQISVSIVAPFVSAWLAVRLSLQRFRSEKWWELRAEAYKTLLESLAVIKHCVEAARDHYLHPDFHRGPDQTLEGDVPLAAAEIHKIAASGPIYVSEKASEAVAKFAKTWSIDFGLGPADDFQRYLDAVNECLTIIRTEAGRDLGKESKRRISS